MPKKGLPTLLGGIGLVLVLVALPLMGACTSAVQEFTVEGFEEASRPRFRPTSITVRQGDEVKITFKNVGQVEHNFVIDELGVSMPLLAPGETDSVEFTADQSGTFAFYCSVETSAGTHRERGMEGELIVRQIL